jgi:hypothetical protein
MMRLWGAGGFLPPELDFEQFLIDFSAREWIAKDTFFTLKSEISMAVVLTPESLGIPPEEAEGFSATADVSITVLMHQVNQPVNITLPPGAEEAAETPVPA